MSATKRVVMGHTRGSSTFPAMETRKPDEGLKYAALMRVANLLGDFSEQTGAQFG